MPMDSEEKFAKEADGSKSPEYCAFAQPDATLEGMTKFVANVMSQKMGMKHEDARSMIGAALPTLKRWRR
jgi:hypothetical protein